MSATFPRNSLDDLRSAVFFDGPDLGARLSRFWILLLLASVIASAGVASNSTATVIGAMIVAPLMTPILGTMLAVVLGDRTNLIRSVALVVAGSAAAIGVGYVFALGLFAPVVAATNAQVEARVSPTLVDLIAALATGVVGSVALVRRDISDTLPGVAIAISLVPPLSVVGFTLEAGAYAEARGALLLFLTNVVAILATGIMVMAAFGVHRLVEPAPTPEHHALNRRNAVLAILALVLIIGVPLTTTSARIVSDSRREAAVRDAANDWGAATGWDVVGISTVAGKVVVRVEGPLPEPDTAPLEDAIERNGVDPSDVTVAMTPRTTIELGQG